MRTKVEMINNPYTQRLNILINGEVVSAYSNLKKYLDEPFDYWCDKILDAVYEECNYEKFSLHFCSRDEEMAVMEKIAESCDFCNQFSKSPFIRNVSLIERIKKLNSIVRKLQSTDYHKYEKNILFVIPDCLNDIESELVGLEVKNSFCKINSDVVYYHDFKGNQSNADVVFLICEKGNVEKYISNIGKNGNFLIELSDRNIFKNKRDNIFCYESTKDSIFDTIFECLLFGPLFDIFSECIKSLPLAVKEKYREELEEIQSIDIKIIPIPENNVIELGKSCRIKFTSDMDEYDINVGELYFSYSDKGIIQCNGMIVEGLKEGTSTLYVLKKGEYEPSASVEFKVIKRNRIEELILEEKSVVMGERDTFKLNLTYSPHDADNADTIEWKSDNTSIATVDNRGYVRAIAKGECVIWCLAETVSVRCKCSVLPYLKSISVEIEKDELDTDEKELYMRYGQERRISIYPHPGVCIDAQIECSSTDMRVVNVVGNTIKACGFGYAKVVIENRRETVREDIQVHVIDEKEYKKLIKAKNKNENPTEKKGLLSKLFK